MKKTFIPIIALLTMAVASCTENIVPTEVVKPEVKLENRDLEEIIQIAQNAPSLFEGKDGTRGTTNAKKEIDLSSITSITNKNMTRTSNVIDTLLYVINYADNNGYVIVSSKKGTPGVIAYIDEGQYNIEDINNKNTDIGYVSDLAKSYINNPERVLEPIPGLLSDTVTFRISPLMQTKWGQRDPEGEYCPNGICGCLNTAMAQIMAYYEYPDTMEITYENADRSIQIFDWEDMKKHTIRHPSINSGNPLLCLASTESHNAIGRLCRQLGKLNNSTYKVSSTSTNTGKVINTATYLGYTCSNWNWYNDTCTIEPLQELHPILVVGLREDSVGHMWIVDGYMDMRITTTEFLVDQETITTKERLIYNHVNWGWDGVSDGYILSSIFDTSRMYQKDPSIHGNLNPGSHSDFNTLLQYIEIFRPNSNFPLNP